MRSLLKTLAVALALVPIAFAPAVARAADLRVCADPDYLPFSNRAGTGFENQIASYVAKAMGRKLVYLWAPTRGAGGFDQFVHETLDKHKCDVVMDVPYASDNVLTTHPYYISSYVFVFPKSKHYDITSMDSDDLKRAKIGFEADTPAENGLKLRTLILHGVPFDSADGPSDSPVQMLDALNTGRISVAVTWEPAVGMFLQKRPGLQVVAVPNSRSQGSPEQYAFPMAMGARAGDNATRDRLNSVIDAHAATLTAILARNGVKLYKPTDVATQ
ncbi:MAG: transporter substrate-binding domain-containing protein [Candidatus Eremiobacteraeota bacterium]|nr:transporter substrate-binding domain-containing protein [Candidatus Eremiobacteraeota bacterium]